MNAGHLDRRHFDTFLLGKLYWLEENSYINLPDVTQVK